MKYLFFLSSLFFVICSEIPWTYSECYNYLDDLNIICYSIYKNNSGNEICQNWEIKSKSFIDNLPNECFNKEYNLELFIKNSNPPLKKNIILFLDFWQNVNIISKEKYIEEEKKLAKEKISKEINNIKQCFKDYSTYEKICTDNDLFNEKDEKLCNELEIRKNNKYCMNLINNVDKDIISKLKYIKDFDQIKINLKDANNNIINNNEDNNKNNKNYDESNEDNENIDGYLDFEEEKINEHKKIENIDSNNDNKKNNYDEELDINQNRSRKDCVEYGLEGNYIVCTKYE